MNFCTSRKALRENGYGPTYSRSMTVGFRQKLTPFRAGWPWLKPSYFVHLPAGWFQTSGDPQKTFQGNIWSSIFEHSLLSSSINYAKKSQTRVPKNNHNVQHIWIICCYRSFTTLYALIYYKYHSRYILIIKYHRTILYTTCDNNIFC